MKQKKRFKRVADALEKLGVAGIAVGIFKDPYTTKEFWEMAGFWAAAGFLVVSIIFTTEE